MLIYTLSGADAGLFTIEADDPDTADVDESVGQIQVKEGAMLDHETNPTLTVTLTATDPSEATDTITVTIHVTDVDEAPKITEGGLAVSGPMNPDYPENGMDAVGTYTASGPEAAKARWMREGADAGHFMISSDGMLKFRSSPDYEDPMDADKDNTYMVTVKANDGTNMAMKEVTVTVTNVDELGTLSGPATASHMENSTDEVGTYMASGPDADMATWTLMGDDMGDLSISTSGVLTFNAPPDFEAPADADGDNLYMVTVKAEVGGEMDTRDVTVTVTNVDEDGMVTLMPASPVVGSEVTASLTDPDGGETGITWQWASAETMDGTFTDIDGETSASYTVDVDAGMYLMATATYTDKYRSGRMATSPAVMVTVDDRPQVVRDYDTDSTLGISIDELFEAIDDYFKEKIDIDKLFEVIDAYFG